MAFANFFRGFFKKHAIATGDSGARQVRVLIFAAAKQAEETSLLFFFLSAELRSG